MREPENLVGRKIAGWTVLARVKHEHRRVWWRCRCDCGTEKDVQGSQLRHGTSRSCGCFNRCAYRIPGMGSSVGGYSKTRTGRTWYSMIHRCCNDKTPAFERYGAKGIRVCTRLRASPEQLVIVIGSRPLGKTIDRIDTNGNYSCGDCDECRAHGWVLNIRWATPTEQARNRRDNNLITINGVTKCAAEWAHESLVTIASIRRRVAKGITGMALLGPSTSNRK